MDEKNKTNWGTIAIQIIIGITTIIVALIQAGNAEESATEAKNANFQIRAVPPVGSIIISTLDFEKFSELTNNFDEGNFNPKTSIWAPADGRSVDGSRYRIEFQQVKVPDLRGQFIRGKNEFYSSGAPSEIFNNIDPDYDNRTLQYGISYQKQNTSIPNNLKLDGLIDNYLEKVKTNNRSKSAVGFDIYKTGTVRINDNNGSVLRTGGGGGGEVYGIKFTWKNNNTYSVNNFSGGGKETRPNNAALNYYVRIN